jgi:hypothetical protein
MGERAVTVEPVYDVSGHWPDVGRFVTGQPDCMVDLGEEEKPVAGKVLKVVVAGAAAAGVPADDITRRGAAVAALVDVLERCGRRCEVEWHQCVTSRGAMRSYSLRVGVKGAAEPVDAERLAFALLHPAMLRRIAFGVAERESMETRASLGFRTGGPYGYPADVPHGERGDVYLPVVDASSTWKTDEGVSRWLVDTLRAQGVEMEEGAR